SRPGPPASDHRGGRPAHPRRARRPGSRGRMPYRRVGGATRSRGGSARRGGSVLPGLRFLRSVPKLRGARSLLRRAGEGARMRELDERTLPAPIYDRLLLWAVLGLTTLGMVMIYSASAVAAAESLGDSFHYVKRQLVTAGLRLGLMVLAMRTGFRLVEGLACPLLRLARVAFVRVLIAGIGQLAGGARGRIRLGGLGSQPAELAKLAIVVYLARSLARKREKVRTFSIGFLPH